MYFSDSIGAEGGSGGKSGGGGGRKGQMVTDFQSSCLQIIKTMLQHDIKDKQAQRQPKMTLVCSRIEKTKLFYFWVEKT